MSSGTLLGICGSLRAASLNRKLMHEAAAIFDPETFLDGDIRFPLFDEDLEAERGVPDAVQRLSDQIASADAVIIACPEYNKALPGALKNALDWVSRTKGGPWKGKPVAIMSATGGRAGGERTQMTLRHCLMTFRPRLLYGPEVLVADAANQFDGDRLTNELNRKMLGELMDELRKVAGL